MSNQKNVTRAGLVGAGVLGLLGVVFVTLKLLAVPAMASWSWWWATAPFWGGPAIILSSLGGIAVGACAMWCVGTVGDRVVRGRNIRLAMEEDGSPVDKTTRVS